MISTEEDLINVSGGDYTLIITDSNGCSHSETYTIGMVVGTDDYNLYGLITLKPNPTKGNVVLNIDFQNIREIQISIYNLSGKEIISFPTELSTKHEYEFDLSIYPDGIYFIIARIDDKVVVRKFILTN